MPNAPREPASTRRGDLDVGRPLRPRGQVGLRGLALLILAISTGMTVVANRREIARLEARIATLRPMARDLVVDDPLRFAVVGREPRWFDENGWDVYIPDGTYRLCLATRQVDDGLPRAGDPPGFDRLAPAVKTLTIGAGRHRVDLDLARDKGAWKIAVSLDGTARVEAEEPKEWGYDSGSSGGSQASSVSRQMPTDRALILFRRRYMRPVGGGRSTVPPGPTDGVLLWIERTPPTP